MASTEKEKRPRGRPRSKPQNHEPRLGIVAEAGDPNLKIRIRHASPSVLKKLGAFLKKVGDEKTMFLYWTFTPAGVQIQSKTRVTTNYLYVWIDGAQMTSYFCGVGEYRIGLKLQTVKPILDTIDASYTAFEIVVRHDDPPDTLQFNFADAQLDAWSRHTLTGSAFGDGDPQLFDLRRKTTPEALATYGLQFRMPSKAFRKVVKDSYAIASKAAAKDTKITIERVGEGLLTFKFTIPQNSFVQTYRNSKAVAVWSNLPPRGIFSSIIELDRLKDAADSCDTDTVTVYCHTDNVLVLRLTFEEDATPPAPAPLAPEALAALAALPLGVSPAYVAGAAPAVPAMAPTPVAAITADVLVDKEEAPLDAGAQNGAY